MESSLDREENIRLAALEACRILDTPKEEAYDDLTDLAAAICGTPIALITLLDRDRQWFKSVKGLDFCQTPKSVSFCLHAIAEKDRVLLVNDTQKDPKFLQNAMVQGAPFVRFYAGAPLVLESGAALGSLCVIDRVPRQLTLDQIRDLQRLARTASRLMDARRVLHLFSDATQENARLTAEAEALLRQSEEQYRLLFEGNPTAMWVHDVETLKIIAVNTTAESQYGYSKEDFHSLKVSDIRCDEESPEQTCDQSQTCSHRTKDGRLILVDSRCNRVQLRGRACCILSIVDVTKQKEAEEALQSSRNEFASAFEHAPLGMILMNLRGGVIRVNRAACEMLGYTEDEFYQLSGADISHPDDRANTRKHVQMMAEGQQKSFRIEKRYLHKSGRIVWAHFSATVGRDREGKATHYIGQMTDITKEREAVDALKESQERLALVFQAQVEGIVVLDHEGKVVSCNPAAERILGFSHANIINRKAQDLRWRAIREDGSAYPSNDNPAMQSFRTGKAIQDMILGIYRPDGNLAWICINTSPLLDQEGKVHRVVSSFSDITSRKSLEEQLRQGQKMQVVGRLAGGVAHDFNNILTAMLMNLKEALDQQSPVSPGSPLLEVYGLAQQGAKLTRQLLEFARQQTMTLMPIEINANLGKFMQMIRRIIGDHIQVRLDLQPGAMWVEADPGMLDQAIMNLVINARDAMPNGGTVTVFSKEVQRGEKELLNTGSRAGRFVCIGVRDTGTGMSPETRKHLFEPFFTTKDVGKGTGLGLPSADGTIHQHRGWIEVSSELGKGSTFYIYLPTTDLRPKEETADISQARLLTETILLVEDHPIVRRGTARLLERQGYRVLLAADSPEALILWKKEHANIDLLLTDMMIPNGMNGLDLGMQLRQEKPGLKMILVSGFSVENIQDRGFDNLEVRFLAKPYDPEVLAKTVRDSLDGRLQQ